MSKAALAVMLMLPAALPAPAVLACEGLVVEAAWVREPPPGADVAAGFMRLSNAGKDPLSIDAVASPCCGHVMLHRTERRGDTMHMTHQDRLVIEPGTAVTLAPGGLHLMLMGLARPLAAGGTVALDFGCGGHQTRAVLPVRADEP